MHGWQIFKLTICADLVETQAHSSKHEYRAPPQNHHSIIYSRPEPLQPQPSAVITPAHVRHLVRISAPITQRNVAASAVIQAMVLL